MTSARDLSSIDDRLIRIDRLTHIAAASVESFHNRELGVFWRNSRGMAENDEGFHPTSTSRCYYSLYEYLRYLYENEGDSDSGLSKVRDILNNVSRRYIGRFTDDLNSVRKSRSNEQNVFTDAHLLVAVSLLKGLEKATSVDVDVDEIGERMIPIAESIARELEENSGGKVHPDDDVHHFVTLHAVRGLDAFSGVFEVELPKFGSAIQQQVHQDTLESLAYDHAGVKSKFDSTELAFTVATLKRFPTSDAILLTKRAIESICASQAEDGSWPTSRLVSYSGTRLLHVASYEVGLTLSNLLLRYAHEGHGAPESLLAALDRTLGLVENRYDAIDGISGWANDHIRRPGQVESWASAIVLTFLIHYRDALLELQQRQILNEHGARQTDGPEGNLPWPDMVSFLRSPSWLDKTNLGSISDPTDNGVLLQTVEEEIFDPITADWVHKPKKGFLFLHGPPGTRKTSFALQLAASLNWPVITLSPSHFLYRGLEGLEVSADAIFTDLMRLRRVVVLLDECEEFFRSRGPGKRAESRTVGSFITAGMLPRIQRLRERHWIILIGVTNRPLDEIDDAVTRQGRFDFVQEVEYPTLRAQMDYTKKSLIGKDEGLVDRSRRVLENYSNQAADEAKNLSFSVLDRWIERISYPEPEMTENEMLASLSSLASQKTAPSLADRGESGG